MSDIWMIPVTKCKRCGRLLTNPQTLEVGYGHICFSKTSERDRATHENVQMKNQISLFDADETEGE